MYRTDDAAVLRQDVGTLLPNGRQPEQTASGGWLFDAVLARAGVYEYQEWDPKAKTWKIVRELVDDSVLQKWVLDGHPGAAPTTLHHPSRRKHPRGVTADSHAALNTGNIGEHILFVQHPKGGFVRASVCLRRADAIRSARDGSIAELSCGYRAVLDHTPGFHPVYGHYDRKQVLRVDCNHVAQVPNGRHGSLASLKTDAAPESELLAGLLHFLQDGGAVQRWDAADALNDFAEGIAALDADDNGTKPPKPPAAPAVPAPPSTPPGSPAPTTHTEDSMNPTLLALEEGRCFAPSTLPGAVRV